MLIPFSVYVCVTLHTRRKVHPHIPCCVCFVCTHAHTHTHTHTHTHVIIHNIHTCTIHTHKIYTHIHTGAWFYISSVRASLFEPRPRPHTSDRYIGTKKNIEQKKKVVPLEPRPRPHTSDRYIGTKKSIEQKKK